MKTSEQTAGLFAALAAAQAEMIPVGKDGRNPHFKSSYTTLGSVLSAVLPALNRHGIALMQHPGDTEVETEAKEGRRGTTGVRVHVDTVLAHKSGQWVSSRCSITLRGKTDAHAVGSAITYLRRYGAQSVCGLPSVDDDGNLGAGLGGPAPRQSRPAQSKPALVPRAAKALTRDQLVASFREAGVTIDMVTDYCLEKGKDDPVLMSAGTQRQMIAWLKGPGGKVVKAHAFSDGGSDD